MQRYPTTLLALAGFFLGGCSIIPGLHPAISGHGSAPEDEVLHLKDGSAFSEIRIVTLSPDNIAKFAVPAAPPQRDLLVAANPAPAEYQIGPGDVVHVIVWDHPELTNPTGEFRDAVSAGRLVNAKGMIYYPYIGEFKAAGLTVGELRELIAQHLSRVIAKPQVDARIVAFRSRKVQVYGEVRQPGVVALDDTTKGIVDAISERGGFTDNASRRRLQINRGGRTYSIDLASLLSGEADSQNPVLQSGDFIRIPDRSDDQVFVLGEVNKEGPVFLQQQRTTLIEALTYAGGLNRSGSNDSGVLVFRRPAGATQGASVYRASLSSAVGLLVAGEFALEPRDIVYVSSTAFSEYNSVINQLLPTISAVFQLDALIRRAD